MLLHNIILLGAAKILEKMNHSAALHQIVRTFVLTVLSFILVFVVIAVGMYMLVRC